MGMNPTFAYVMAIAFWTVLVAELVGDKTIYSVASLALRFRPGLVFAATTIAFAGKALAAVLLAQLLVRFHSQWVDILSAAAFFVSAFLIWFKEPESVSAEHPANTGWLKAAAICFGALFFTEWGDPGQIALAAITMKSHSLLGSWLGGTLAMGTKGALAITLGLSLRNRLPMGMLRATASGSCCLLGILALAGIFVH
jgi:putative Ca2+/H+ antiporter (TMEM165/GDT1 family)